MQIDKFIRQRNVGADLSRLYLSPRQDSADLSAKGSVKDTRIILLNSIIRAPTARCLFLAMMQKSYAHPSARVRVIFLRGGDGAKDGQRLVGGEQGKQWSQQSAGKEARVENGKSGTGEENPAAQGAG